jgi:hypothetical protein
MEDKIIYIQIPCSEELPKIEGKYHVFLCNNGEKFNAYFEKEKEWITPVKVVITKAVTHWLKPVSESKMACDFAEWCADKGYTRDAPTGGWYDPDTLMHIDYPIFTTSELMQEFIKNYKG